MTRRLALRSAAGQDDSGIGMVIVVLFLAVALTMAGGVFAITLSGLHSASRDRQALSALATAEGGVAQAIQVIRSNAPGYFTCTEANATASPPSGACATNPAGWTSPVSPEKVSANGTVGSCLPSQACYSVWISTLTAYNPLPTKNAAGTPSHTVTYRIHSTGIAGGGPAGKSVVVDVQGTLASFPMGLYGDTVYTNGTPGVHNESVFSAGCITSRSTDTTTGGGNGLYFTPYDPNDPYADYDWGYDQPEGAHSATVVTTQGNLKGSECKTTTASSPTTKGPIHEPYPSNPCASLSLSLVKNMGPFPFDQDSLGSTSATCNVPGGTTVWTSPQGTGATYPSAASGGTYFDMTSLYKVGYRPQGLSPGEYDSLRQEAVATGTYLTGTNPSASIASALAATTDNTVVLYIDEQQDKNGSATITPKDIPSRFFRTSVGPNGACPSYASLIIVVRNGGLSFNATGVANTTPPQYLAASLFVPEGSYTGNGSANVLGTIYAATLNLGGTQDFRLDSCFVNNPPALLVSLKATNYHEVETQNIQ